MMFKEDIKTVFPLLKELYDLDGLILVGSDVALWKELSEQTNIENVHYVNTQEQKQLSFPSAWHVHEQLLAKDDGIVSYYDLSNSQLSGVVPSEALRTLWRNLKTVDVREKKALSLETFMSNLSARKNALVVNSFDAVDIVQNSAGVEVVVAHTIDSDDENLTHYSKNALDAQMKKLGYKLVALLEDKHPQVFSAVYAMDKEKVQKEGLNALNVALQTKTQESEKLVQEQAALKEEKQKVAQALETEKAHAAALQKEKEETAKALQNKNSEVETLKNELKTKTETLTKSLEQEKQNTVNLKKELETLNAALQTKAQENEKLVKEQARLKEEKQKVAQALEAEKVNAVKLQKEKEETAKTVQNKNSEVETLKNGLKTKTEALTKSLEQEKQNSTSLKKERETLNAALQTKRQENDKLLKEFKIQKNKLEQLDLLNQGLITRRDELIKKERECKNLIANQRQTLEVAVRNLELKNNFYIKPTYISRTIYTHYNDQKSEDEWQLEVYLHALGLMKKYAFRKVVDLGCGSGYKLMHYLSDYKTTGLELKENLAYLRKKYPDRKWLKSDFFKNYKIKTDVLICSDVIEHLVDPDELLEYIKKISFKYLVLSTPDRSLIYDKEMKFNDGPPRNPAHVREWTYDEFAQYIGKHFDIIDHRVTNMQQGTQMIIAKKRGKV